MRRTRCRAGEKALSHLIGCSPGLWHDSQPRIIVNWNLRLENSHAKQHLHQPVTFTPSSKRRRGFPSETCVKRGLRIVHNDKELLEKLGRNDPCPCGSGRQFRNCCLRKPLATGDGARRNHFFQRIENRLGGFNVPPTSPDIYFFSAGKPRSRSAAKNSRGFRKRRAQCVGG